MQSEQDETRLFKGKKKEPTPQEERVHHQHVLKKKNRSAFVFSCLTLPLLQLYPNEANESGSLDYYPRSKSDTLFLLLGGCFA